MIVKAESHSLLKFSKEKD